MILSNQPKTFAIALKDHPVSEKQLKDCLSSAKKNNWSVEIFWGVYGNTLTPQNWIDVGVRSHIRTPGAKGCWFSHYYLWKKCIDLDEPIVVLEHDAIIQRPWESLEIDKSIIKFHRHYRKDPTSYKWNHPVCGRWSPSTHAYCISPAHAVTLIEAAKNLGAYPADVFMGSNIISVELLGEPELVARQNTHSTTENLNQKI
jgi:GR25 family glycosyltransferase involved in LPS biosynthesis